MYEFVDLLSASPSPDDLLPSLGKLMNDSMLSCQTDCESSCPELDEMTSLALKSGAFGSRVTGGSQSNFSRTLRQPLLIESQ